MLAHGDLEPYESLFIDQVDEVEPGDVRVTFAGVSTLYISDGTTGIMVDGFFSRPGVMSVIMGEVGPDEDKIDDALARLNVSKLDAIFPVHAHYDHAMDTPVVAQKTGAVMLGDKSSLMIARGVNLAEDRLIAIEVGKSYQFGAFDLRFLETAHAPVPTQAAMSPEIDAPLVPPADAFAYPTGQPWSALIGHTDGNGVRKQMLVQGSAGFVENNLQGAKVDAVFLGTGGLGSQDEARREQYWKEIVTLPDAARVYPTHWDDFFLGLDEPLKPTGGPMNDFDKGMQFIIEKASEEGRDLHMMRAFATVLPFKE